MSHWPFLRSANPFRRSAILGSAILTDIPNILQTKLLTLVITIPTLSAYLT